MAESTLTLTYTKFADRLAVYLGYSSTTFAAASADDQTRIDECIQTGYRRFLYESRDKRTNRFHKWSFLEAIYQLTTSAPYTTGTLAIASGVVTLTGGTWPSWAAQGELEVEAADIDERLLTINTRDNGSQLTLDNLTVSCSAGATYTLYRAAYDMPDDFGGEKFDHLINRSSPGECPIVKIIHDQSLRDMVASDFISGVPQYASKRNKTMSQSVGQRFELSLYPFADDVYMLELAYKVNPSALSTGASFTLGGPQFSEAIMASMMSYAEQKYFDTQGIQRGIYEDLLAGAIDNDKQLSRVSNLGRDPNSVRQRILPSSVELPLYGPIRMTMEGRDP